MAGQADSARLAIDAMGSRFEIFVSAARDARAIAEIAERVIRDAHAELTRFEPGGAVWRVNHSQQQEASDGVPGGDAAGPANGVPIDPELSDLLARCAGYERETGGAFSVARCGASFVPMGSSVVLSGDRRAVRLVGDECELDLGGVAKGYALDLVREAFEEGGPVGAFVHGGTSTILAIGSGPTDASRGWSVRIDPGDRSPAPTVRLADRAMSVSSQHGDRPGHIVDPRTGRVADGPGIAACIGESAEETDVWATALTVLGARPGTMPQRLTSVIRSPSGWVVEGPDRDCVGLPTSETGDLL